MELFDKATEDEILLQLYPPSENVGLSSGEIKREIVLLGWRIFTQLFKEIIFLE